jgi:hypothetical protein
MIRGLLFKHVTGWDTIPADTNHTDPNRYAGVVTGAVVPVILHPDEPGGDTQLRALYAAIGCDMIERVILDAQGDAAELYIDEEGLLRQAPPNRMWSYIMPDGDIAQGWYKILGHAVAVGVDRARGVLRTPTLEEAHLALGLASEITDGPRDRVALRRWLEDGVPWVGAEVVEAGPRPSADARPIELYPTPRGRA